MKRAIFLWPAIALFIWLFAALTASAGTVNYTYDDASRLIKADYGDERTIIYAYDRAGNVLRRVIAVEITLADAILALQVLAGNEPSPAVYKEADLNGDAKMGLGEVVSILQKLCEVR